MKKIHFKNIDSTNTYLKENFQKLPNFTIVSASYQSKGRGRYDRVWESNSKENLMFSILIKDKELMSLFPSLSLATSCAILQTLKDYKIDNLSIKWPNDVYVNDKKICGILLESISNNTELEVLIVGVGLNVNQKDFSEEIAFKTTSMYNEINNKTFLPSLKRKIYKSILNTYLQIKNKTSNYINVAKNNNYLLNKEVFAEIDNTKKLVKVIDINDDNTLKVIIDQKEYNLSTGEITFHK